MNDQPLTASTFAAASHSSLRSAGLVGDPVSVAYTNRALHLDGATSGSLRIEAGRCARVRFGYFQGKYHKLFVARIWLRGEAKPLIIEPAVRECPNYGAAMRLFAQAVAATRGMEHVERGLSGLSAALVLILPLLMVLGLSATAYVLMGDDLRLGWYSLLAVSWFLAAIFIWLFFKRQRPRAVASLDELEVQLPA